MGLQGVLELTLGGILPSESVKPDDNRVQGYKIEVLRR